MAFEYFKKTYGDENRAHQFSPLDGMERPGPPEQPFKDSLNWRTFQRLVMKKRNGAAAGLNGLNYVIYKKLPAVTWKLFQICCVVKRRKQVPPQWAVAYMVMLAKYKDVSSPDLFRNIALTNCDGKLFMTSIATDIERFAVANKYIDTTVQKGFLTGVAGCIEHNFCNQRSHERRL